MAIYKVYVTVEHEHMITADNPEQAEDLVAGLYDSEIQDISVAFWRNSTKEI